MQRIIFAGASVILGLGSARAAGAQSEPIPRDVVAAILRHHSNYSPRDPMIIVGDKLPPGYEARMGLPRGSHVMVTLRSVNTVDIIGRTTQNPDSVRAWFLEDFERRGYEPRMAGSHSMAEAFRPADRSAVGNGYCGQGWHYNVSAEQISPFDVEFVVHVIENGCASGQAGYPQFGSGWQSGGFNPPGLPVLYRPRLAEPTMRCTIGSSGSGSYRQTQETLATTMNPNDLLAYYGRQLDSAGWKAESRLTGASGTWTKRDSTGRDLRTTLTVLPARGGSDCRTVTLSTGDIHP